MTRYDDTRSLLRSIYSTAVYRPRSAGQNAHHPPSSFIRLLICLATLPIRHLCAEISATQALFPVTDLRVIYELVSAQTL
jgi:hypothetical protein